MAVTFTIPQDAVPLGCLKPATDAAGRTGTYYSLKNVIKAFIAVHMDQGNAATIALTPKQASAVAGTGSKALTNACQIFTNLDVATNGGQFTRQTDATSYTTDVAVKEKIVVFEIDPAQCLDMANGFDCLSLTTGASNVANITEATIYVVPKYPAAGISYIAD